LYERMQKLKGNSKSVPKTFVLSDQLWLYTFQN
jgi:hypothetical protein